MRYEIFDVEQPLMKDNAEVEAKNSADAVKFYLKSIGEVDVKFKVSGSRNVRLQAKPYQIKNGIKTSINRKRSVWYEVINLN